MPELSCEQSINRFTDEGKGKYIAEFQNIMNLADLLLICKYSLIFDLKISEIISALNSITEWDVNFEEFVKSEKGYLI